MSAGPAYDTKEQVRQAIDIVDLVGRSLQLRRQGRGYVGLCPWHDDSKPSLQVNPDRQSWKCWVCDIGGDVFSWTMQQERVDFREALVMLADRAGIELQSQKPAAPIQPGSVNDKQTLYRAVTWAEQQFHLCLLNNPDAEPARRYLQNRSVTADSIKRFHLGFSPDSWQWLLDRAKSTPFSPQILEAVGLIGKNDRSGKYYDRFKGRVIFPIRDTERRPIAFGGRVLPELAKQEEAARGRAPAKYVNSPETRLFSKSDQLYGLDLVRDAVLKSREVVIVEGYTDVVMSLQAGLDNVVAVLGTALGERHIRLLRRFADRIILVLDGDEAGQRRTNEVLALFVSADVDLRILTLPAGLDPCDFVLERGADGFRESLSGAVDALEHKIVVETRGVDLASDTHRASRALENILSTIAQAPRLQSTTTSASRLREQQILARLSRQFQISEDELRTRVGDVRRQTKQRDSRRIASPEQRASTGEPVPSHERELLEIFIAHPELAAPAIEAIRPAQISHDLAREIYEVYVQLSGRGEPVEFARVLTELEDPRLKSLLVQIDETADSEVPLWDDPAARRAANKHSQTQQSADERLRRLIDIFADQVRQVQRRKTQQALEQNLLNEEEQLAFLQKTLSENRSRQGISKPTDG